MSKSLILEKSKRGPGSFTSSNITIKGGKYGTYTITFDIAANDLASSDLLVEVTMEELRDSAWQVCAKKVIQGPWTKSTPPQMSVSWNNPGEEIPQRTMRVTISLATRITAGVSIVKED